jgi:hypothetical protein
LMPQDRPSLRGSIATRAGYRTPSTTSYLTGTRISSRSLDEEGCPQDGDGAPPGCDSGVEHPLVGFLVRD